MINYLILVCDTFTSMLLFSGWYIGMVFVAGAVVFVVLVVIVKYRSRMRR